MTIERQILLSDDPSERVKCDKASWPQGFCYCTSPSEITAARPCNAGRTGAGDWDGWTHVIEELYERAERAVCFLAGPLAGRLHPGVRACFVVSGQWCPHWLRAYARSLALTQTEKESETGKEKKGRRYKEKEVEGRKDKTKMRQRMDEIERKKY